MAFQLRTVAVIGAGHVGSHCAYALAMQGLCDRLVMIDLDKPKAQAQAADLADAVAYLPHRVAVLTGNYADCADADIVVLSAGPLPQVTQTRTDILEASIDVMKQIIDPVVASGFSGIFVVITNPCDVIARYVREKSGFPANRVLSTSTALDSARLRLELSQIIGIDPKSIDGYVLGEHGESQMVPWSHVAIGGKPLLKLMREHPETYGRIDLTAAAERTRRRGWSVLSGKGSTEFGISTVLTEIVRAIFHNEHRILPVSVLLEGQYGQRDVYASVPAVLGKDGVEGILELDLTDGERGELAASCEAMRSSYALIQR